MSTLPSELRYTVTHEWVKCDSENTVLIGITDHAQMLLGDVVFVELPKVGQIIEAGEQVGVIESVKSTSDYYSPLSGEVIEINEVFDSASHLLNQDPYGEAWLYRLQITDKSELDDLMDADLYAEEIAKNNFDEEDEDNQ